MIEIVAENIYNPLPEPQERLKLPRCEADIKYPDSWHHQRQNEGKVTCSNCATIRVNGKILCRKHAGSLLVDLHTGAAA